MPITKLHERKKSKNIAVAGLVIVLFIIILAVTFQKLAS
jgi:hypothetical protein